MSETIELDQNNRQIVKGIVKASSVTCSVTSAADVYVHVITKDDTAELYKGDGTVIPKLTRTRFYVFRKNPGNAPFSATVVIVDLPEDPAKKADMMATLSLVKPMGKPKSAKTKKSKKKPTAKAKKQRKKTGARSKT